MSSVVIPIKHTNFSPSRTWRRGWKDLFPQFQQNLCFKLKQVMRTMHLSRDLKDVALSKADFVEFIISKRHQLLCRRFHASGSMHTLTDLDPNHRTSGRFDGRHGSEQRKSWRHPEFNVNAKLEHAILHPEKIVFASGLVHPTTEHEVLGPSGNQSGVRNAGLDLCISSMIARKRSPPSHRPQQFMSQFDHCLMCW